VSLMRAAFYLGPGCVELRRVPVPWPRDGELLVKVEAAVTCGTDVKTYRRGHPKFPPPFAFGHEFGGEVAAIGSGVAGFRPGMRVTALVFAECGHCFYCRKGQGNLCENLVYNFGAFAEYLIIPAPIVRLNTFIVPSSLSYAQAAIVEPLTAVVHGQHLIGIRPGESVAIIGAGGAIGLLHQQLAQHAGAEQVIAIGRNPVRLSVAHYLGATACVNAHEQDTAQTVRSLTGGHGADVVIECAGTKLAWETALETVRPGGRVLWFGGLPSDTRIEFEAARVHYGEIALFSMHGGTAAEGREAFDLISANALNVQALLSGELPLEQVDTALKRMITGEAIKLVINPWLVP
jgi:L-iditol 2-dehydrogenase